MFASDTVDEKNDVANDEYVKEKARASLVPGRDHGGLAQHSDGAFKLEGHLTYYAGDEDEESIGEQSDDSLQVLSLGDR